MLNCVTAVSAVVFRMYFKPHERPQSSNRRIPARNRTARVEQALSLYKARTTSTQISAARKEGISPGSASAAQEEQAMPPFRADMQRASGDLDTELTSLLQATLPILPIPEQCLMAGLPSEPASQPSAVRVDDGPAGMTDRGEPDTLFPHTDLCAALPPTSSTSARVKRHKSHSLAPMPSFWVRFTTQIWWRVSPLCVSLAVSLGPAHRPAPLHLSPVITRFPPLRTVPCK
jgi:hypothetical protein